jgi:outer membrane receptor protein involved in Fe transport
MLPSSSGVFQQNRANYSRAVRAPNVSETGFPLVPNFSNGFVDPCNPASIGTGIRATNCLTAIGAANLATFTNITQSLPIVSGSNPNLNVEKSDSYTYGVVIQPSWVPGLSLSADYYDINVKGIIASVSPQGIVNQCYDSPTLNNIFCGQFTRWAGPGTGPLGETPGRVLGNSLINAPLNFANRKRRGLDVNLAYRKDLGPVDFSTSLIYTHNFEISNFQDPTNPKFETRLLGQLGDPKDEFRWDFDFGFDAVTFGYRLRYIGPMFFNGYSTLFALNGLPASNVDAFPDKKFASVMYHDVRVDFDIGKDKNNAETRFYFGVDNVLDKGVPRGAATATGSGSAIYSFRGRNLYAGFRARF